MGKFFKIHIFSPGKHKSASGHDCEITDQDLRKTAEIFLSNHRVPLTLGHSSYKKHDVLPSMGWFRDVKIDENGNLYGLLEATTAGQNLLDKGYYENFSASFYAPDSPLNPKPGTWTLRHVAALGAEPPALKELDPALEIIPEDFSESDSHNELWYEFREEIKTEDFSGDSHILPDTFDFRSFRKFGPQFRCKPGSKSCKGRCIPKDWECRDKNKATKNNATLNKNKYNVAKDRGNQNTQKQYPQNSAVSQESFDDKRTKENRESFLGNTMKAAAAIAVSVGLNYAGQKAFPDNKEAQAVTSVLGKIIGEQITLKDEASLGNRAIAAGVTALQGGVDYGIKTAMSDDPGAEILANATTGIIATMFERSGVLYNTYDSYCSAFYKSGLFLNDVISNRMAFEREKQKKEAAKDIRYEEMIKRLEQKVEENTSSYSRSEIDDLLIAQRANIGGRLTTLENSAVKSGAALKKYNNQLGDTLERIAKMADKEQAMDAINLLAQAHKESMANREKQEFAEDRTLKYPNTQMPISLSKGAAAGIMLPLILAILRAGGFYRDIDFKEKIAQEVKSANPKLDAIFSEVKNGGHINEEIISSSLLKDALFSKGAPPQEKIQEISNVAEIDNSTTINNKTLSSPRRRAKLAIDALIDDALMQAYSFSEEKEVRNNAGKKLLKPKSQIKKEKQLKMKRNQIRNQKRSQNFSEGEKLQKKIIEQETSPKEDSLEVIKLRQELALEKKRNRRLEIENFAESLYREGRVSNGYARKNQMISFLESLSSETEEYNFSEDGSYNISQYDFMKDLLQKVEPIVSFSEVVTEQDATLIDYPDFNSDFNRDSQILDRKIAQFMEMNPNISYEQAWAQIIKRGDF